MAEGREKVRFGWMSSTLAQNVPHVNVENLCADDEAFRNAMEMHRIATTSTIRTQMIDDSPLD